MSPTPAARLATRCSSIWVHEFRGFKTVNPKPNRGLTLMGWVHNLDILQVTYKFRLSNISNDSGHVPFMACTSCLEMENYWKRIQ